MEKILNIEIFDMYPCDGGFIFSKKIRTDEGKIKISYNFFSVAAEETEHISRVSYLEKKFGEFYRNIANQLGDYVTCDCAELPNGKRFVIFPSGEYGLFSQRGIVERTGDLLYRGERAHGVCVQGENFWSVVPNGNCVVRYGIKSLSENMRIGGGSSSFARPEDAVIYGDTLYVSCADSKSIKTIDLSTFDVNDYIVFDEPVWKYFKTADVEIVLLNSGIYIL